MACYHVYYCSHKINFALKPAFNGNYPLEANCLLVILSSFLPTELEKRKVDLQNLRNQVEAIRANVSLEEAALNATAEDLLFRAENLSAEVPGKRVAFSVTERTEKNYGAGVQVLFETVEVRVSVFILFLFLFH